MSMELDTNFGVDFERAKERLHAEAGRLYRRYWAIRNTASPAAVEEAKAAWTDAQARAAALRRQDEAAIRAVLASGLALAT
ncbi:hypothetical protein [Dyella ginsengisoli]|uniref:hypothetical protein n=1 Tax=Dyella ginsengisoli TaxID=363848 RepID=UPI000345B526|nr:hypothetical protein [Dyella ginsengisoli]